jgi:hypothetical protein
VTRGRRQLGRPAAQRDRIGICTRRLPPRPSTPRNVGVATVDPAQRMYESSTEEGSTANFTHQIRFYDAKGRHGEKRIRKFRRRLASDVRMVRRTRARDRMPQHGRITAHWKSEQQAAGRPGSARFATEGCTCPANTRGRAGRKRGLALGHITTEQPATDPADSPVCIGLRTFGFVFSPKENEGKKLGSQYFDYN